MTKSSVTETEESVRLGKIKDFSGIMRKLFVVLEIRGEKNERYLTLTECSGNSENRYHVSLTGKDASVDWQEGDLIWLELGFSAYKHKGQWHTCHNSNTVQLIDIDKKSNI